MSRHLRVRDRKKRKRRPRAEKGLPTRGGAGLTSGDDTMTEATFEIRAEILKNQSFDEGLVLGWAIICKEHGEPYFDLQGDHITELAMLRASTDFAENSRVAKDMHRDGQAGTVVHTFPMTTDIAKAFGVQTDRTGLMIAMRPDEEMLDKFKSGELTGFSIGGVRGEDEEVE